MALCRDKQKRTPAKRRKSGGVEWMGSDILLTQQGQVMHLTICTDLCKHLISQRDPFTSTLTLLGKCHAEICLYRTQADIQLLKGMNPSCKPFGQRNPFREKTSDGLILPNTYKYSDHLSKLEALYEPKYENKPCLACVNV